MSKKPRFPPSAAKGGKRSTALRQAQGSAGVQGLRKRVVQVVLFPGFQIIDAAGPIGAFEVASRFAPGAYDIRTVASVAGLVPSSAGVPIPAEAIGRAKVDTCMVVGGNGTREALQDEALIHAIARAPTLLRRPPPLWANLAAPRFAR